MIRSTNDRYNCIAAQVEKHKYFHIKTETSKDESFVEFVDKLYTELKMIVSLNQLKNRTIFIFDNASIHLTEKVEEWIKKNKMV